MEKIKNQIASALNRFGVSANFLTVLGLFFALVSAAFIYRRQFFWAGTALLISGALDLLDGAVARAAGNAGNFGGVLDSSLDRYGDGVILGALVVHFAAMGRIVYATLALSALVGSFAISYVRARAECEVESCRIGFWERGERLVYLALGLLLCSPHTAVLVLGTVTHITVFQRIRLSKRLLTGGVPAKPTFAVDRGSLGYWAQAFFWIFFLIFSRLNLR